jgi:hypothetical protein
VEAVYCVGNITGNSPQNKETLRLLAKEEIVAVQGEMDWRYAEGTEPADWPGMTSKTRDRLVRMPHVLRFDLAMKKAVAFYGDYIQRLDGYSDYDPYALEMNMVCGLADFMRDEAVFPALEAMTPQFQTDLIVFGQTEKWGRWRLGGKDIVAVGPAWDEKRLRWGLLAAENGDVQFNVMEHD